MWAPAYCRDRPAMEYLRQQERPRLRPQRNPEYSRPMPSSLARRTVGPFFVFAGLMHFARTRWYVSIMPDYLPAHHELVYASGAAEMLGGAAAIASRSRFARWWLIATLLAVFPANVHMAWHPERYTRIPRWVLYARLPFQAVFVTWVWRGTR
jgi:uncharacterized membrane protein